MKYFWTLIPTFIFFTPVHAQTHEAKPARAPIHTYTLTKKDGSTFSYTAIQTPGFREPLSGKRLENVTNATQYLSEGDPVIDWDNGSVVSDGSDWTSVENQVFINCHAYAFHDLIELTTQEWLEGFSSDRFENPVQSILDHVCEPIVQGAPTDPRGQTISESLLSNLGTSSSDGAKWIFTLGFYPAKSNMSEADKKKQWFRHSGEIYLKDGRAFTRSKLGEGPVMEAYLLHVMSLYVGYHENQKIPDPLKLSIYRCRPYNSE